MHSTPATITRILPLATEAAWTTSRWNLLEKYLSMAPEAINGDFNVNIARILQAMRSTNVLDAEDHIKAIKKQLALSLSAHTTASLSACHDTRLKLHVLAELELIVSCVTNKTERAQVLSLFDHRLAAMGSFVLDKQYLLGIRRAGMSLTK
jgi:serine/threonine-protein kinase ATR